MNSSGPTLGPRTRKLKWRQYVEHPVVTFRLLLSSVAPLQEIGPLTATQYNRLGCDMTASFMPVIWLPVANGPCLPLPALACPGLAWPGLPSPA